MSESGGVSAASDSPPLAGDGALSPEPRHPIAESLDRIADLQKTLLAELKSLDAEVRALRKDKDLRKACKKRRRVSGAPTNLTKPVGISEELCAFLGKEPGSKMVRSQVTSVINEYAKEKGLKKDGNGRVIVADSALAVLLGLDEGAEVQILRIPTHLKNRGHYIKDESGGAGDDGAH